MKPNTQAPTKGYPLCRVASGRYPKKGPFFPMEWTLSRPMQERPGGEAGAKGEHGLHRARGGGPSASPRVVWGVRVRDRGRRLTWVLRLRSLAIHKP